MASCDAYTRMLPILVVTYFHLLTFTTPGGLIYHFSPNLLYLRKKLARDQIQ